MTTSPTSSGRPRLEQARATRVAVPSATVVVVRDHDDGLQVLLQERALASDFVGGAWVFPGGKVDARDAAVDPARLRAPHLDHVRERFGAPTDAAARGLLVAAVRETFEEAGILLADRAGVDVTGDDLATAAFAAARAGLADRAVDHDWRPFLDDQDLVLRGDRLWPLAWWITPHGVHRRFSARFFVAAAPTDQGEADHDDVEMTDTVWSTPAAALQAASAGERMVIYPTRMVLASLLDLPDVAAVLDRARTGGFDLRPIIPLVRDGGDGIVIQHPDGGPTTSV